MTDVPEAIWQILVVEDDEELARTTAEGLRRRPVSSKRERATVDVVPSFEEALRQIEERRYDLIILDIREEATVEESRSEGARSGDDLTSADKGLWLYDEIRARRFVPVVFYSAVAHLARRQHDPPFVTVVSKLEQEEDNVLRKKVIDVFDSPLPRLNRALVKHVDKVLRGFMLDFVEKNWRDLNEPARNSDLAYLLARRLAHSLGAGRIDGLDSDPSPDVAAGKVHPTRLFVVPPTGDFTTGDLFCNSDNDWYILLTPACDLVLHGEKRKAEFVVMAHCLPVTETAEYKQWLIAGRPQSDSNKATERLNRLLANNRQGQQDRYYFLPAAWGRPDLVVDLQRLHHLAFAAMGDLERVATLDDPYAQSLVAQLGRYIGRMGTPDLDVIAVRGRLPVPEADPTGADAASLQGPVEAVD